MKWSAGLLLVLMPLAGCLEDAEPQWASARDATAGAGDSLTVQLEDIPAGANALLLEVAVPKGAKVWYQAAWAFPDKESPGDPLGSEATPASTCMASGGPSMRTLRVHEEMGNRVTVGALGLGPESVTIDTEAPWSDRADTDTHENRVGGTQPFYIGLQDADAWKAAGATWSLTLHSDQPIEWRTWGPVAMDCIVGLSELEGGTVVDAGFVQVATDMGYRWHVDLGGLFLGFIASTVGYDFAVSGPDLFWDGEHAASSAYAFTHQDTLRPGNFDLELHSYQSVFLPAWLHTLAMAMLDLPEWAHTGARIS